MPRFIPPHLMLLVTLLIIVVWIMLLRHFRGSVAIQKFVAETLGDDTPENALRAFELAKQRLRDHLNDSVLDSRTRRQINLALGSPNDDAIDSDSDTHPL